MTYKVGVDTPNTIIGFKPGDKVQIDSVGNTARCVGYQISSGNKFNGYTSYSVWYENGCWMMLHPTDDKGDPIPAPNGAVISPEVSFY